MRIPWSRPLASLRRRRWWLLKQSFLTASAYVLLVVLLVLLQWPSRSVLTWTPALLGLFFVLFILQRRSPGPLELALVTVVLAQVAAAKWSMILDDAAAARQEHSDQRAEAQLRARDMADSLRHVTEEIARDSLSLSSAAIALSANEQALVGNLTFLAYEDSLNDNGLVPVGGLRPVSPRWWDMILAHPPAALLSTPGLVDSLQAVAANEDYYQQLAEIRQQHFLTEGQGSDVQGQRPHFMIRLQLYDRALMQSARQLHGLTTLARQSCLRMSRSLRTRSVNPLHK